MDVRGLRATVAVADHLHFGRAAHALQVAPSSVSQSVRDLEADLGVVLFERTTRSVRITPAGLAFVDRVRPALAALDAAADEARAAGRGERGRLSIGLLGSALLPPLPRALRAFRQRRPDVEVTVSELTSVEQLDGLRAGRLDVGFVRPPLPAPYDAEIDLTVLRKDELVAVLPRAHRLARSDRLSLRGLQTEPFVRTPRRLGPGFYDLVTGLCHRAGFEPRTVQEATQIDSVIGLVAAGFGVSVIPAPSDRRRYPDVAFVTVSPRSFTSLAMAVPGDRPVPAQVQAFVSLVHQLSAPGPRAR